MLRQAEGPDGRQARALGQDAGGRRYYRLGGDAGAPRVFVDAGPAASQGGGSAAVTAAEDEPGGGLFRSSSVASGVQYTSLLAVQRQQSAPLQAQLSAPPQLQPQQPEQQLPAQALPADPLDAAWGWYEADQLPALLEWLEGGDDSELALADALFEAMLPWLPAPLAGTAPSQVRALKPEAQTPHERMSALRHHNSCCDVRTLNITTAF